jgi:flagellar biogenesis protein FliO
MEWLQSLFSGESPALTLVLTFFAIAALLIASIWLFRKIAGGGALKPSRSRQPRLSVTDAAIVDEKRRLVLVRRDNVEHLVMIGGPSDIVIEQNIIRAQPATLPQQREAPREPAMPEAAPPRRIEREPAADVARDREAERAVERAAREREAERAARLAAAQRAAERAAAANVHAAEQRPARTAAAAMAPAVAAAVAAPEPELPEPETELPELQMAEMFDEPFAEPAMPAEPAPEDFEIDFEGELERSLEGPAAPAQARGPSLESELSAELSDDLDFAKLLGEDSSQEAVPAITTPEPSARKRRQDNVDDEMQRLLDELANA